MHQVFVHQLHRQRFVFGGQRFHNFGVLFVRMLGRVRALVHQRDEGAARNQLAQQLGQHLVAHQLGHAHMKVAQQLGAARHVLVTHGQFFLRHMLAQRLDLAGRHDLHKGARHFGFQHAAHRKHLLGLFHRRRRHKGPPRGFQPDQPVLRQLKQRLAHQRARHAEVVGQFLLGQLGARVQAVFHDGAGQRLDNVVGAGRGAGCSA